ncbi:hypothetical protein [Cryptosporangium aurantiacum]|uniref:Uncharacterized protein n=1 Tax=Cryptosporangium aurantiacum TaxID=134849 RepID=A0A1M7R157_9ACTN|nr:hypothetical protein [Cryptosporangium aurantiacum]SHN38221.1 hypothetical protein SAMN05443668_10626 [Cryptosporangium aurantiacum]
MTGLTMVAFIRVPREQAPNLKRYEDLVLGLLPDHGALVERRMLSADGSTEAHLLSFPSRESIDAFDADPRRAAAREGIDASGVQALRFLVEPEDGPQGIVLWRLVTEGWFGILLERGQDLAQIDLLLLADVLFDTDEFVAAAAKLARDTLGRTDELTQPEITFYPGAEWVLRFAEGGADPDGVLVVFHGRDAVRLEDLDAGDVVE